MTADGPLVSAAEYVSYEKWGADFFRAAVTAARVHSGVAALAGRPLDFGPVGAGPGKIARISATGAIGEPSIAPVDSEALAYRVVIPVVLDFELGLPDGVHRFHATLEVPVVLTARALTGLRIYIDVDPPTAGDVVAEMRADGLRATLVQWLVPIEAELRRFVATYVAREVMKPEIADARVIDVAGAIDRAWSSIAPAGARRVSDDLNVALETEIREREDDFLEE